MFVVEAQARLHDGGWFTASDGSTGAMWAMGNTRTMRDPLASWLTIARTRQGRSSLPSRRPSQYARCQRHAYREMQPIVASGGIEAHQFGVELLVPCGHVGMLDGRNFVGTQIRRELNAAVAPGKP